MSGDFRTLPPFATTLMFKLNRKLSTTEFLRHFDACFGGQMGRPYDFVHMPWSTLAVVNFTSPEACAQCCSAGIFLSSWVGQNGAIFGWTPGTAAPKLGRLSFGRRLM
ncbi:unnamed protein product [Effrenium voratum]|nr:unnamed protein product [Effrenium voratum]